MFPYNWKHSIGFTRKIIIINNSFSKSDFYYDSSFWQNSLNVFLLIQKNKIIIIHFQSQTFTMTLSLKKVNKIKATIGF